jgi:hypothetical protein
MEKFNPEQGGKLEEEPKVESQQENELPVVEKEDNLETGLADKINSAENIDQLCDAITEAGSIKGSKEDYDSKDLNGSIRDIQRYMRKNIKELELAVITGKESNHKEEMGKMLIAITRGGDLDIRQKAKDLLKVEMESYFEDNREELVIDAVANSHTLEDLFVVIGQFKGINGKDHNEELDSFHPSHVKDAINEVKKDLDQKLEDGLAKSSSNTIKNEVNKMVKEKRIPEDSNIDQQVKKILFTYADQKRVDSKSDEISEGILGRWGRRIGGFFRR